MSACCMCVCVYCVCNANTDMFPEGRENNLGPTQDKPRRTLTAQYSKCMYLYKQLGTDVCKIISRGCYIYTPEASTHYGIFFSIFQVPNGAMEKVYTDSTGAPVQRQSSHLYWRHHNCCWKRMLGNRKQQLGAVLALTRSPLRPPQSGRLVR